MSHFGLVLDNDLLGSVTPRAARLQRGQRGNPGQPGRGDALGYHVFGLPAQVGLCPFFHVIPVVK